MEEGISDLEDRNLERHLWELLDFIRKSNRRITGVPEGDRDKKTVYSNK